MSKSDFLAPVQSKGPFTIPLLGEIYIKEVAFSRAVDAYQSVAEGEGTGSHSLAKIVVACVVDADGNPIFDYSDIPAIANARMTRMKPLVELVMEHSGVDSEEFGDIEGN